MLEQLLVFLLGLLPLPGLIQALGADEELGYILK
jgi:hypothetical protein